MLHILHQERYLSHHDQVSLVTPTYYSHGPCIQILDFLINMQASPLMCTPIIIDCMIPPSSCLHQYCAPFRYTIIPMSIFGISIN